MSSNQEDIEISATDKSLNEDEKQYLQSAHENLIELPQNKSNIYIIQRNENTLDEDSGAEYENEYDIFENFIDIQNKLRLISKNEITMLQNIDFVIKNLIELRDYVKPFIQQYEPYVNSKLNRNIQNYLRNFLQESDDLVELNQKLTKEINLLTQDISNISQSNELQMIQNEKIQKESNEFQLKNRELQDHINQLKEERQNLMNSIRTQQQIIDTKDQKIQTLEKYVDKLYNIEMKAYEKQIQDLSLDLKKNLNDWEQEKTALKIKNKELQDILTQINQIEKEKQVLAEELNETKKKNEQLQSEKQNMQKCHNKQLKETEWYQENQKGLIKTQETYLRQIEKNIQDERCKLREEKDQINIDKRELENQRRKQEWELTRQMNELDEQRQRQVRNQMERTNMPLIPQVNEDKLTFSWLSFLLGIILYYLITTYVSQILKL